MFLKTILGRSRINFIPDLYALYLSRMILITALEMRVVMRELYSVSCIGVLPFIEDLLETVQSGLVASSRDSEEHA